MPILLERKVKVLANGERTAKERTRDGEARDHFVGGVRHLAAPFAPLVVREPPRAAPFPGDSCRWPRAW